MPERDPWELPSGGYGPTVPYTFDVLTSRWIVDPTDENNPDVPKLQLKGVTDDPDWEEWELNLRVEREGWEIIDGGERIVHDNTRILAPSRRTQCGTFIMSVKDNEELTDLWKLLRDRSKTPTDATIWRGLRLLIGEKPAKFKDRDTGETRDFFQTIVIGFEGELDDAELSRFDAEANERRQQQEQELIELVQQFDSHGQFANHVMTELDLDDQDLINDVMDVGDEGFYARNKK